MRLEIKIDGLNEINAALIKLGPELANQAGDNAIRAMAKPIIETAKRLAPVRTGRYRNAIGVQIDRRTASGERRGFIGVKAPWHRISHLLEFGTSRAHAYPHMRPALDAEHRAAIKAAAEALARNVRRVTERLATGKAVKRVAR